MIIFVPRKVYRSWLASDDRAMTLQNWNRMVRRFCDVRIHRVNWTDLVVDDYDGDYEMFSGNEFTEIHTHVD